MTARMTPEERAQLSRFLQMLEQAQAGPKDPEAQALISQAASRQPDAAYLLVQRVLQLEMAQQASQAEIARLKQQMAEGNTSGLPPSFFGGSTNAWGRRPEPSIAGPAAAAAPQQAPQSAWGGGLMGTVASTAAGVLAGSLLAHGIGSLFGNREAQPDASTPVPSGGGTLVETDYGAGGAGQTDAYIADDFNPGDSGGGGDVG